MGKKRRTSKFVQQSRYNISNLPYKSIGKQMKEYERAERIANRKYAVRMMKISDNIKKSGVTDIEKMKQMFKESLESSLGTTKFENPEDNKRFDDMIRESLNDLESTVTYSPLYSMNISECDIRNNDYFVETKMAAIKRYTDYLKFTKYVPRPNESDAAAEEDKEELQDSLALKLKMVDRYIEYMSNSSHDIDCRYFELALYQYILNSNLDKSFYFVSNVFSDVARIISDPSNDYNKKTIKNMNNVIMAYLDMNDTSKVADK